MADLINEIDSIPQSDKRTSYTTNNVEIRVMQGQSGRTEEPEVTDFFTGKSNTDDQQVEDFIGFTPSEIKESKRQFLTSYTTNNVGKGVMQGRSGRPEEPEVTDFITGESNTEDGHEENFLGFTPCEIKESKRKFLKYMDDLINEIGSATQSDKSTSYTINNIGMGVIQWRSERPEEPEVTDSFTQESKTEDQQEEDFFGFTPSEIKESKRQFLRCMGDLINEIDSITQSDKKTSYTTNNVGIGVMQGQSGQPEEPEVTDFFTGVT
ncbi:Hypothetical protein CINCED_3A020393 [Cinara cedri]|uniref:Uncharacterized protein n=1 Tax=Cinara cedri TaxID=506608 RepID=A0A5E4NGV0_9HEMI|nr:Hypothetical protein CINCED_3A020393 [Cinara cedri]